MNESEDVASAQTFGRENCFPIGPCGTSDGQSMQGLVYADFGVIHHPA